MTRKYKGFTLIELLVVIAIIGILASIVLVSLGGARAKAKDAAIIANMDSMRLALEMEATDNPSTGYSLIVGGTSNFESSFVAASSTAVTNSPDTGMTSQISIDKYCIALTLNTGTVGTDDVWCVDSAGSASKIGNEANCDVTNYDCAL